MHQERNNFNSTFIGRVDQGNQLILELFLEFRISLHNRERTLQSRLERLGTVRFFRHGKNPLDGLPECCDLSGS